MKNKGFFQDSNGDWSMMRLLAFIVVICGCLTFVFSVIYSFFNNSYTPEIIANTSFVATGFTAKWLQKSSENKQLKNK